MKLRQRWIAILVSAVIGIVVNYWKLLLLPIGYTIGEPSVSNFFTSEYFISIGIAIVLGFVFFENPAWCGIMLMLAPVSISHAIYLFEHGLSAFWPAIVIATAFFTIPYLGAAYVGSWLRRNLRTKGAKATKGN